MAKAWTAPVGDVRPDSAETKIKILRAEQNRLREVARVINTILGKDERVIAIDSAIGMATMHIGDMIHELEGRDRSTITPDTTLTEDTHGTSGK